MTDNLLHRYKELEKHTHEIENQNNLLRFELNQKAKILSQVTKELSQIQIEYKEAVDKIVELSSIKKGNDMNANSVSSDRHRNQVQYTENSFDHHFSYDYSNYFDNNDYCKDYQNTRNENASKRQNYSKDISDKMDSKIRYYTDYINQLKKEIKRWKNFAIRIFDISSEALGVEPEFPNHESSFQRQVTTELVEQLAKKKADDTEIQRKYQALQNKYNSLSQYLNKVKYQCNVITEKTQNCFRSNPHELVGEISRIEEIVKSDDYYNDPISLRNYQSHKRSYQNNNHNDDLIDINPKYQKSSLSNANHSDKNGSSFSSFDNSFESIKNLVKSFSRQYKREDSQSNEFKEHSSMKNAASPSVTDFSFESRNSILSDFN